MPELVTCPSCGCKVQAAELLLGKRTRCIACGHVFLAGAQPNPPAEPIGYSLQPGEESPPEPPRIEAPGRARHQLPLCPRCHRPVKWEEPVCPHCAHPFEAETSARRPPWALRRDGEPHRGKLIDNLGSLSLLSGTLGACVPLIGPGVALATGIPALVMAHRDLEQMNQGLVDPEGRRETELGRNKAIVGVVLAVVVAVFYVIAIVELSH